MTEFLASSSCEKSFWNKNVTVNNDVVTYEELSRKRLAVFFEPLSAISSRASSSDWYNDEADEKRREPEWENDIEVETAGRVEPCLYRHRHEQEKNRYRIGR